MLFVGVLLLIAIMTIDSRNRGRPTIEQTLQLIHWTMEQRVITIQRVTAEGPPSSAVK